jgi:hypothetical protein
MKVSIGIDSSTMASTRSRVYWDTDKAVNGHILLVGMSGAGKTFNLKKLISHMTPNPGDPGFDDFRVNVFDVHGDIDIKGASEVLYSEITDYGINPLKLNPDPHYGGVRKRIERFIYNIKEASFRFGDKQEAVLRYILQDLYHEYGFIAGDPDTWEAGDPGEDEFTPEYFAVDGRIYLNVPFAEKDEAKKFGAKWDAEKRCWYCDLDLYKGGIRAWIPKGVEAHSRYYPTLEDAVEFAQTKLKEVFLGIGREGTEALTHFTKRSAKFNKLKLEYHREKHDNVGAAMDEALADLESAGEDLLKTVEEYIQCAHEASEVDDVLRYTNVDLLKGIVEKLDNFKASGIFKKKKPPFDPNKKVWRHNIKPLSPEEQKMFVLFSLERILEDAMSKGITDQVRDVIVLDEASKFFSKDEKNIISIIANEARKFGIALIAGSQSPSHFSEDFIASVGTKIILGIDEMYWNQSVRKLNLSLSLMERVQPQKTLLMQTKKSGAQAEWKLINVES